MRMKMLKAERSRDDVDDLMIWDSGLSTITITITITIITITCAMVVVASVPRIVLPTDDPSVS